MTEEEENRRAAVSLRAQVDQCAAELDAELGPYNDNTDLHKLVNRTIRLLRNSKSPHHVLVGTLAAIEYARSTIRVSLKEDGE